MRACKPVGFVPAWVYYGSRDDHVDKRNLVAELFAVGFRWSRGMRTVDLWHPGCEIGINI
jgi:hypothetical protein